MATQSFIQKLVKSKSVNIDYSIVFNIEKILQTICAFLNEEGGWVLIGFDGNSSVGVEGNVNHFIEELDQASLNEIFPQPLVYISGEDFEGKSVVLINVHKGSDQPYSYKGEYYVRKGNKTKTATSDELSLLLRSHRQQESIWERLSVTDAEYEDLNPGELSKTFSEAKKKDKNNSLPDSMDEFLSYYKLKDYSNISNGAMLLFGFHPTKFIPQCRIRIIVMPYGKKGDSYADELIIEENLFASLSQVMGYFSRSLPLIGEFNSSGNRDTVSKYPIQALREAIVNAIVHRDYSDFSGDITINIYLEKIEIINSGEISRNIIDKNNKILPHHSVLRSPTIAHMFYLRGKMEKVGRGLNLIKDQFVSEGYKSPIWKCEGGYTTLTLYSEPEPLDERMIKYLYSIGVGSSFTSKEYELYFSGDISERTARNDIAIMVSGKYISREGQGPSTRYIRTGKPISK